MKDVKSEQKHEKSHAEIWVEKAKKFGEKCFAIQQDPNLSIDQKLEKQKAIGSEITKEIQNDTKLNESDQHRMKESIKTYMDDWEEMHANIQNVISGGKGSEKKENGKSKNSVKKDNPPHKK